MKVDDLVVGQRVELRHDLRRRDDDGAAYTLEEGLRGTVTESTEEMLTVEMDTLGVLAHWHHTWSDIHHPTRDLMLLNEPLEDVCEAIRGYGLGPYDSVTLDESVADELEIEDPNAATILTVDVKVLEEEPVLEPLFAREPQAPYFSRGYAEAADDILEALREHTNFHDDDCAITLSPEVAYEFGLTEPGVSSTLWGRPVYVDDRDEPLRCTARMNGYDCAGERNHASGHSSGGGQVRSGMGWPRQRCEAGFTARDQHMYCELDDREHEPHVAHGHGGARYEWTDDRDYTQYDEGQPWPWNGQRCVIGRAEHHWTSHHQDYFIRNLEICTDCLGVRGLDDRRLVRRDDGGFDTR